MAGHRQPLSATLNLRACGRRGASPEDTRKQKEGVRGEAVLKWERAWQEAKATTAGQEGLTAPSLCFKQEKSSHLPSRCQRGQHVTGPLGAPSPCPAHVHPGFLELPEAIGHSAPIAATTAEAPSCLQRLETAAVPSFAARHGEEVRLHTHKSTLMSR